MILKKKSQYSTNHLLLQKGNILSLKVQHETFGKQLHIYYFSFLPKDFI